VFAESRDRVAKERSMRRRQLKWLWQRLNKLSTMNLTRDALSMNQYCFYDAPEEYGEQAAEGYVLAAGQRARHHAELSVRRDYGYA
jgi:hypothetical protein